IMLQRPWGGGGGGGLLLQRPSAAAARSIVGHGSSASAYGGTRGSDAGAVYSDDTSSASSGGGGGGVGGENRPNRLSRKLSDVALPARESTEGGGSASPPAVAQPSAAKATSDISWGLAPRLNRQDSTLDAIFSQLQS